MAPRILVCGDAMQDQYWRGEVTRVSPEASVPILTVKNVETRAGGAANVANNIEAMGVQVERLFGRSPERIQKIRLLSASQHIARVDFDHPQEPVAPDATFADALGRCQFVVFVDYGKGSLAHIASLLNLCRAVGRPALIDPKGHDYAKYRGATLLKPNLVEMRDLVGGWANQDELDFKARQFLASAGIESMLLTRAAEGMTLYTKDSTIHVPADNPKPVDVSGAGEAALAAYAAALAKGYEPGSCVRYASKAAGLAIGEQGTVVCTEAEVFGAEPKVGQSFNDAELVDGPR